MQVPEPEFEGQTKTRLGNPEVATAQLIVIPDAAAVATTAAAAEGCNIVYIHRI